MSAGEIASLFVKISAQTEEFQKGMQQVTKGIQQVTKDLQEKTKQVENAGKSMTKWVTGPIVAAGTGLTTLAIKTGNFADELLDLSAATGISTDKLQHYRKAEVAAGVTTDSIANSISRMNRQMQEGGEYSSKLTSAANNLGVSLQDANGKVRDASEVHHDLMLALSAIDDPQERARQGALAFGRDWESIAPVVDLGREKLEQLYKTEVISKEQLDAANKMREEMDGLKHEFSMAFMAIGTKLAPVLQDVFLPLVKDNIIPAIEKFIQLVVDLIKWFTDLSPEIQKLIAILVLFAASIGPVIVVTTKIIALFTSLTTAVLPSLGAAFAYLLSPIGLVIAAIAAAIAIGVLLWQNWDEISQFLTESWGTLLEWADKKWNEFGLMMASVWEGVKGTVTGGVNGVISGVESMVNGVIKIINAFINTLNQAIQGMNKVPGVNIPLVPTLQNVKLPKLQKGSPYFTGGLALVGEMGPELVNLPRGSRVNTHNQTSKMLGGVQNIFNIYETQDANETARQVVRILRLQGVT